MINQYLVISITLMKNDHEWEGFEALNEQEEKLEPLPQPLPEPTHNQLPHNHPRKKNKPKQRPH